MKKTFIVLLALSLALALSVALNLSNSYEKFIVTQGQDLYQEGQRSVFWGIVNSLEKDGSVTLSYEDPETKEVQAITLIEKPAEVPKETIQ